ncbi:hypothetical protein [Faecalimicrobium sp. JNUCC 81]
MSINQLLKIRGDILGYLEIILSSIVKAILVLGIIISMSIIIAFLWYLELTRCFF